MLWDLCWVEEGWAVRAQAGKEGPGSPGAVLTGTAQPQPPQVGASPLPETQGRNQLRSQGRLGFTAAPLFDNHWRNCITESAEVCWYKNEQYELKKNILLDKNTMYVLEMITSISINLVSRT